MRQLLITCILVLAVGLLAGSAAELQVHQDLNPIPNQEPGTSPDSAMGLMTRTPVPAQIRIERPTPGNMPTQLPSAGSLRRGLPTPAPTKRLSLIHISEPTRLLSISYAVFCLKKKKKKN
eukprot:TRINITY_DN2142_c0_g1_i2.p3 TRINITY_DN2142_c0_g1~~TRINITY_DN2142_c0_g1_i2.p3  ORF type:complete len:120 (+),score=17.50 TRINITY_DN2142_c0_g1_i2:401-760(+)